MSELLFPEITETPAARTDVAVAAGQAIDLEKVDLKKLALARFGDWPAITAATKADLERTALDLSNQSRINEAKSLRERKINAPLATARATAKGLKSRLSDTSKAVGDELVKIEAAWADVATAITPQIEAAQARIDEAARLEREREERRKDQLREHIKTIRGYLEHCQQIGMTSDRVANGMAALGQLVIDKTTYAEFEKEALQAREETLAGMQRLHDQLKANEAEAERQEAIRLENERIAQELREAQARINAEAEALRRRAAEIAAAEAVARKAEADRLAAEAIEAARNAAEQDSTKLAPTGEGKAVTPGTGNAEAAPSQREDMAVSLSAGQHSQERTGSIPVGGQDEHAHGGAQARGGHAEDCEDLPGVAPGASHHQPAAAGPEAGEESVTGTPDGHLLQDCHSGLSQALASKPDAMQHAREAAAAIIEPATLKLGDINARLNPLKIDATGLEALGVPHAERKGVAYLYRESDWPRIKAAIVEWIGRLD